MAVDERDFDNTYVPVRLAERVRNAKSLSFGERFELTWELSEAAWAKIGVVRDPSKPVEKTPAVSYSHKELRLSMPAPPRIKVGNLLLSKVIGDGGGGTDHHR
jgi:hypothetical protein